MMLPARTGDALLGAYQSAARARCRTWCGRPTASWCTGPASLGGGQWRAGTDGRSSPDVIAARVSAAMNRTLTTEDVAFLVTDHKLNPAGLVEGRERRRASRGGLARRYVLDTRHRLRSRRWEHLL